MQLATSAVFSSCFKLHLLPCRLAAPPSDPSDASLHHHLFLLSDFPESLKTCFELHPVSSKNYSWNILINADRGGQPALYTHGLLGKYILREGEMSAPDLTSINWADFSLLRVQVFSARATARHGHRCLEVLLTLPLTFG